MSPPELAARLLQCGKGAQLELRNVDLGVGQAHRDRNRDISSRDGYMCCSRLAHRKLNDAGIPTPRGHGKWSPAQVARTLEAMKEAVGA